MKLQLQNKKAMIESKNKLLNILTIIEMNQKYIYTLKTNILFSYLWLC